jgi:hypothetical protein
MARVLIVAQDKGGVGKSTAVRAVAEAVPGIDIIELDAEPRLLEFDADRGKKEARQVRFFPMRAEREEIDRTRGRAAREEFDAVIQALAEAGAPTILDVGANTALSFFTVLGQVAPDLKQSGVEIGVLVVLTAEPAAIAGTPRLLSLAEAWAAERFVLENRMRGAVEAKRLASVAAGARLSAFDEQAMEDVAVELVNARGLRDITRIDRGELTRQHGVARGARIASDLARFRLEAMRAVQPCAEWVVG